jgi:predicted RNA-binding protein YlxR (DUF448 family)
VRRARGGSLIVQFRRGSFGRAKIALRVGQALIGDALLLLETRNLLLGLRGPAIERNAFLFRLTPLQADHFGLACQPKRVLAETRQLRVMADDFLLLPVLFGRQRRDRRGRFRDGDIERRRLVNELCERSAIGHDPLAELFDFPLGRENAARFGLRTTRHHVGSAEHIAGHRRNRDRRFTRERDRLLERFGHERVRNHLLDRRGVRADDAQHVADGHDPRRRRGNGKRFTRMESVGLGIDHHESATSRVVLANQREAGRSLIVTLDDDVLEQIAKTRFDRAFVAAVHLEIVGNGALLADMAVGLNEHHACRIAKFTTCGDELLERRQPRFEGGEVLFARANAPRRLVVCRTRGGKRRLLRVVLKTNLIQRLVRAPQRLPGGCLVGFDLLPFDENVRFLDVQLGKRLADTRALRRGVVKRVPKRRDRVGHRVNLGPRPVDFGFKRMDLLLRARVCLARFGQNGRGFVARPLCLGARLLARIDGNSRRLSTRIEVPYFVGDLRRARPQ